MNGKIYKTTNLFGETVDTVIPEQVRNLVEEVLRDIPQSRNDDMLLYTEIWKRQGIEMNYPQFLKNGMKPETIGRHKRQLQEKGLYPANVAVQEAKAQKEKQFRDYYGQD